MSEINFTDREASVGSCELQPVAVEQHEGKLYLEPDPTKGKTYASFDDFLHDFFTPEEIVEMRTLAATQTVGRELTNMRITAGISQKVMAAALGVSQPRISAIESALNSKASWKVIQKYVEVTQCPFKAVLEDGSVVSCTRPGLTKPRARKKQTLACA